MRHAPLAVYDETGRVRFANASWRALPVDRESIVPHVRVAIRERRERDVEFVLGESAYTASIYPFDDVALVSVEVVERLLGQRFVEVISHELRTPLATMSLWVDVLHVATTEDVRARAAQAIADSCAAQTRLVGELLDLSRALAGTLLIDRRSVEVDPLVREVCDAAVTTVTEEQIDFTHTIDATLGTVIGDAARIHQIIATLVETAIDRTPNGGSVSVSARRTGDAIEIQVRDSGSGATADQIAMMFEPFAAEATGAFALRVSLAHHLVRLHAGTLVATSEGLGFGTRFACTLPLEHAASAIT